MKKEFNSTSLVIIANDHNPSLISDNFLLKSKIIKSVEEVDRATILITPAICNINLKNKINISLDPKRLAITSKEFNDNPFRIGKKYCQSLPFIKGIAVGINFEIILSEYDIKKWFLSKNHFDGSICYEVKYKYNNCNVSVTYTNETTSMVNFNFHYGLDSKTMLSDIDIDFQQEWKYSQSILDNFIKSTFN